MAIRSFIALETPEAVRTAMEQVQAELRTSGADVRWEAKDKLHATIKFLGNVEESGVPRVVKAVQESLAGVRKFGVVYTGLGCFPSPHRPRVVWIGCESAAGMLKTVKDALDKTLLPYGFEVEQREFHPHVTLGRVRSQRKLHALTSMLQTRTFEPHPSLCKEILLMKSALKPQGSEYTVIQTFLLQ